MLVDIATLPHCLRLTQSCSGVYTETIQRQLMAADVAQSGQEKNRTRHQMTGNVEKVFSEPSRRFEGA